ncbi:MAG: DNA/RNA non-specific endonuclease, partial [Beijerinckiaceae bacterium]
APDDFALFSDESDLDYALIAIGNRDSGSAEIADLGYCPLSDVPDRHVLGMAVNVIQHPGGMPKMIACRNNRLHDRTPNTLLYETDTQQGSSGSPVFNDDWDVIALHHYGEPFRALKDETGRTIPINMNEGIRISAIFKDLTGKLDELEGEKRAMLEEALGLHAKESGNGGRRLRPPQPGIVGRPSEAETIVDRQKGDATMTNDANSELRLTIPLEISIRIGGGAAAGTSVQVPSNSLTPTPKTLARAAEKLKIDANYDNRDGYFPGFIPGVTINLPEMTPELRKAVAPLRAGEVDAEGGELKYQHFSIRMNKLKRIAIFSATNIDGETYLAVDRDTGRVVSAAEGESWAKDPRISPNFTLNQDFYSEWSIFFDRGHLTRRTDPTWGEDDTAERANADTYHFSNCAPQHFRFNQRTEFWQGAERYVLEKGAVATKEGRKISVFQGPIFDDTTDRFADDVQIPSSFFKVIVWNGKSGLKSVALVVDQLPLLDEERKNLARPSEKAKINVAQWRVAVTAVEKRTGLDFGKAVRDADTIASVKQPKVGERMVRLESLEGLLA